MALRGTLRDFALPDIFQLIGMQRKTGMLTLESDRETVIVVFENGEVVHADSTVRRLDDLLGNVLVRQGKLRKEDLDQALARQKVSMQRLGYILTTQGFIESGDLKAALSEQVQQMVFRIFRWKDGQYHFDPQKTVDYDREHVIPVSADHILMEGIRRVDEWPIIEKRIPSLEMSFRPLVPQNQIRIDREGSGDRSGLGAAFDGSGGGEPSSSGAARSSGEVVLSEAEAAVYDLVDQKVSIESMVDMSGMSDFDVCRILFDFIDRNLIVPAGKHQERLAEAGVAPATTVPPRQGIALPALVLLACVVGIFLSVSAPFRIPGRPVAFPAEIASFERAVSLARLQKLDAALRTFFLTHGARPDSLEVLLSERPPLVSREDLQDAKGVPFLYGRTPDGVTLMAVSESGEPYLTYVQEFLTTSEAQDGLVNSPPQ